MAIMRGIFAGVRWGRLTLGVCLTAVLALSVHVAMLQLLQVPYPHASFHSALPDWLNSAVMLGAAVWLYGSVAEQWRTRPAAFRLFILFALLFCLNEGLRAAVMNGYCSARSWFGRGWFGLLAGVRDAAYFFIAAGLAASIGCFRRTGWRLAGVILSAAVLVFVVSPSLAAMEAAIRAGTAHGIPVDGWCELPYGMDVVLPAYLTFVEPVLASLVCVALVWRRLPGAALSQAASFALLVLALKKQLLMSFLYAAFTPGPILTALASMGQFSLEAAALGFLTASSWRYARKNLSGLAAVESAGTGGRPIALSGRAQPNHWTNCQKHWPPPS